MLAITASDFLAALVITRNCLEYLQALTSSLQEETKDIITAVEEINIVTTRLQQARDNIHTYHSKWISEVEKMGSAVGVQLSLPRRCSRQTQRSNVPADTPSLYYCRSITIPMIDHLLNEMSSQFDSQQQAALLGFNILPSVAVTLTIENCINKANALAEVYIADLPSPNLLNSEIECWHLEVDESLERTWT